MGISVEKIGIKPVDEQKTSSTEHAPQKTEQEESIFIKAKDTSWTTADTVSVVTGTILGLALYRFMPKIAKSIKNRNANKNIIKAIENTIKKGEGHTVSLSKLSTAKTGKSAAQVVNSEEKAFYESILKDFDELHPEKVRCYPSAGTYCSKTHINGALSEISYSDRYVFDSNGITKHLEQKENSFEYILGKKKLNCYPSSGHFVGDDALIQEYKTFLNGRIPNADNFKEFMKAKDIDYIKSNGILGLEDKAKQISLEKGEIIKAQEELRHKDLQNMYKGLWRPYPSKQFYRVVGREELIKMLNGEKIMSPRYAQYGKECTDISTNPYYHEIMLTGKYRISFKRVNYDGSGNASFARAVSEWAPENSHWHLHRPYDISDVKLDEIKAWNGDDWIPVKIITEE